MMQLNKIGYRMGSVKGVHAMTDVTGFGLLGHLTEMAEGSQLCAEVHHEKVPGSFLTSIIIWLKNPFPEGQEETSKLMATRLDLFSGG